MPRRPTQHQIADQAVSAVRKIWADVGAGVEEIRRDYGEDLLVQPQTDGRMDSCRLWVQVKGHSGEAKGLTTRKVSIRFRNELLLRWARTADEVVIVYWDVSEARGWYALPAAAFDELDLLSDPEGSSTMSIERSQETEFNSASALLLTQRARSGHVARLLGIYRSKESDALDSEDSEWVERVHRGRYALVMQHMIELGIFLRAGENGGIRLSEEFVGLLGAELNNEDNDPEDELLRPILVAAGTMAGPGGFHESVMREMLLIIRAIIQRELSKSSWESSPLYVSPEELVASRNRFSGS